MAAYVIGDIKVTDPDVYAEYAAGVPATSEAYGGRYLVRGAPESVRLPRAIGCRSASCWLSTKTWRPSKPGTTRRSTRSF